VLRQRGEALVQMRRRLGEQVRQRLASRKNDFAALEARLRLLGPEQVLARGYSITTDAQSGKVLREARAVRSGQLLKTRLKEGEVLSRAEP
jgi:exodeoxyribonuclease VII large subunit